MKRGSEVNSKMGTGVRIESFAGTFKSAGDASTTAVGVNDASTGVTTVEVGVTAESDRLAGFDREGSVVFVRTGLTTRGGTGMGGTGRVVSWVVGGIGHEVRLRITRLLCAARGGDEVIIQLNSKSTPTASALPTGKAIANRYISRRGITIRFNRRHGDLFDPRCFAGVDDTD
jgi:hypothetical protein